LRFVEHVVPAVSGDRGKRRIDLLDRWHSAVKVSDSPQVSVNSLASMHLYPRDKGVFVQGASREVTLEELVG